MSIRLPRVVDIAQKKVLVRVDFNVPLKKMDGHWRVGEAARIEAALPLIEFLVKHQARVILMSHLGRPEAHFSQELSLQPVVPVLEKLLNTKIQFVPECVGEEVRRTVEKMQAGEVLLLENLRFHAEEEANDPLFSQELARLGDAYINEAFSASHRAHASTEGVTHFLESYAGFALAAEVKALTIVRDTPARPLVVIIGGAKISDKVEAVVNLAHKADVVLLGGGVANNFLKADGLEIHKSYVQDAPADLKKKGVNYVHVAQDLLGESKTSHIWLHDYIPLPKILYPLDVIAASSLESTTGEVVDLTHDAVDTPQDKNLMYLDIGPKTIKLYAEIIATAKTVFWNGPMGVFENKAFAQGTRAVGQAVVEVTPRAKTILGGGETLAAAEQFGLTDKVSYVSTAGGASLDFLAGKVLPGLKAVM